MDSSQHAGWGSTSSHENTQPTRRQNFRKYQNMPGNYDPLPRQPNYNIKSNKVIKEDEFEAGSIFNPGSKKQNLSHLLNFQYEPRGSKNKVNSNNHSTYQAGATRKGFGHYPPRPRYNKEQYLQAK